MLMEPCFVFMSMRFLGGEKYILPVIFSPVLACVMVMSAEKGCGIWAHADETAKASTIVIVSFTYAVCFMNSSPHSLDKETLIYDITNSAIYARAVLQARKISPRRHGAAKSQPKAKEHHGGTETRRKRGKGKSKTNPKVQGHGARKRTDWNRNLLLGETKLKKIVASRKTLMNSNREKAKSMSRRTQKNLRLSGVNLRRDLIAAPPRSNYH